MSNRSKSTGSKILNGILAVLLVLVLAAGVVGVGYMSDWFTDWSKFEQEDELPADEEQQDESGMIIGETTSNGVSLLMTKLSSAEYDEYGISPLAVSAYSITATLTPGGVTDKTINWSLSWSETNSADVNDYVTLSSTTSQSGEAITVTCLQGFSVSINLTATSALSSGVSATCKLEYAYRSGFSGSLLSKDSSGATLSTVSYDSEQSDTTVHTIDFDVNGTIDLTPVMKTLGVGTIENSVEQWEIYINGTQDFADVIYLISPKSKTEYVNGDSSYTITTRSLIETIYSADVTYVFDYDDQEADEVRAIIYNGLKEINEEGGYLFEIRIVAKTPYINEGYAEVTLYLTFDEDAFLVEATGLSLSDSTLIF